MTTIKNNHLLSVYVPEVGTPQALEVLYPTTLTAGVLETGSLTCDTTSTGVIDGVANNNAVGVGLSVDVRIVDGELRSVEGINTGGLGYSGGEYIEVDYQDGASGNKAQLYVDIVDEDGAVEEVTILENGDSYSVVNGVIDTLEIINNDGDRIDVQVEISNADFSSVKLSNVSTNIPTAFSAVGDVLDIVDSGSNVQAQVRVITIGEKISGGLHKYSGEKLTDDVKEIIANEIPPIITNNEDYNPKGPFSAQGEIRYNEKNGVLTYHRTEPFDRALTDLLYVYRDGDEVDGTYNFTDLNTDQDNPTEIINVKNSDGESLKIDSSGVVNQPNVNTPVEDGDLVNKKYIDDLDESTQNQIDNITNIHQVIKELLEFDAFGDRYNVNIVNTAPLTLDDGNIYLLTSETPTEIDVGDEIQKVVSYENITEVFISKNNTDGNEVFSDFTQFTTNSELTINQLKIETSGGFGRFLIKSDATILTDGAKYEVEPFRVSLKAISEVDEAPTDGTFRQAETSVLLRVSAVVTYEKADEIYVSIPDFEEDQARQDNLILELEEELEAIAPNLERGSWVYSDNYTKNDGEFGFRTSSATVPTSFSDVAELIFNKLDSQGNPHGFGDVEVGQYVQLFQEGSPDSALYQIDAEATPNGDDFNFDVTFVRSIGDFPDLGETFRFKFFSIVDGNPDEYVQKSGDEMSGTLTFKNVGDVTDLDFDVNKANLTFRTTKSDNSGFETVSLYQNGLDSSLTISGGVVAKGSFFSETGSFFGADPSGRYFVAHKPRLQLDADSGKLWWDGEDRLTWTEEGVTIVKPFDDATDGNAFTIEGATVDDYSSEDAADVVNQRGRLLGVYHNANAPDAINYHGKITNPKNIVTKEYVDDAVANLGGANNYYQDTPPQETVDLKFNAGDLWIDSSDLTGYVWAETAWAQMSLDGQGGGIIGDYVEKDGDTMTGPLNFAEGAFIDAQNASSLSGRAGLEIKCSDGKPLAITHTESSQSTLEIYGFDGNSEDGRKKNLYITSDGNINLEGNVNAKSYVKGSELRTTKITSGQSSNLEIYRGFGADEKRKMLIGSDSVNVDADIRLTGNANKNIIVQNGSQIKSDKDGDEIITFGGTGAFYRGTMTNDEHMVNKKYIDDKFDFSKYQELS